MVKKKVNKHHEDEFSNDPDEEQGIKKDESEEEHGLEMKKGNEDEDVYTKEGLEELEESDEIDPQEEAFMEGYIDERGKSKCAQCGVPLSKDGKTVEREINGKPKWFCSEECAEEYEWEYEERVDEDL